MALGQLLVVDVVEGDVQALQGILDGPAGADDTAADTGDILDIRNVHTVLLQRTSGGDAQNFTGLGGGGGLIAEELDGLHGPLHQHLVGGHDLPAVFILAEDDVILHAHTDVSAQRQSGVQDRQVGGADAKSGPCGPGRNTILQINQILHRSGHTAQHPQTELVVTGGGQVALLDEVIGDAQHTGIKDLDLRA